jgi:hypothetical protein
MMAGTAGDEVLFRGRGFKTVLQEEIGKRVRKR